MSSADLAVADRLREAAGWNQTLDDWRRFLQCQPEGCFVAEWSGQPVATLTTTGYQHTLAWIGMVLVDPAFRRRGIARCLLEHGLNYLKTQEFGCVKLDATPVGKQLYDQLGFRDESALARWARSAGAPEVFPAAAAELNEMTGHRVTTIRPLTLQDWTAVTSLDRRAFGADRRILLERMAATATRMLVALDGEGFVAGYGMLRPGSRAGYLGPIVASGAVGGALVEGLIAQASDRPLFWDIPEANRQARELAQRLGFTSQRPFVRMTSGSNLVNSDLELQFAIGDPATG